MTDFHKLFFCRISTKACEFKEIVKYNNGIDIKATDIVQFVRYAKVRPGFISPFQRYFVARDVDETVSWAKWYVGYQTSVNSKFENFDRFEISFEICRCSMRAIFFRLMSDNLSGYTSYGIKFGKMQGEYFLCEE